MTNCPLCHAPVDVPDLETLVLARNITGSAEIVLRELWRAGGHGVTEKAMIEPLYVDDVNGGPSDATAHRHVKRAILDAVIAIAGSGVMIVHTGKGSTSGYRLRFQ
ncbi:hypothetical protein [Brucella sp. 191011898]|uniref:hypothetical protein n=1 Tax=Brucella sp. 191011898 TaxID=2730447 RepID=UPI0015DEAC94|nr:hypothetical protein [Brucella sp. 191011898]CAB4325016.1 hypothetical protein BCH_00235 [Brucella sp. 191011898]